jgi:hypothetical protein
MAWRLDLTCTFRFAVVSLTLFVLRTTYIVLTALHFLYKGLIYIA